MCPAGRLVGDKLSVVGVFGAHDYLKRGAPTGAVKIGRAHRELDRGSVTPVGVPVIDPFVPSCSPAYQEAPETIANVYGAAPPLAVNCAE